MSQFIGQLAEEKRVRSRYHTDILLILIYVLILIYLLILAFNIILRYIL